MAKYQKTELKNLNFELCGGKVNIPLSIRLQEYPGMSDLWHSHDDFAELVIGMRSNRAHPIRAKRHSIRIAMVDR